MQSIKAFLRLCKNVGACLLKQHLFKPFLTSTFYLFIFKYFRSIMLPSTTRQLLVPFLPLRSLFFLGVAKSKGFFFFFGGVFVFILFCKCLGPNAIQQEKCCPRSGLHYNPLPWGLVLVHFGHCLMNATPSTLILTHDLISIPFWHIWNFLHRWIKFSKKICV